MTVPRPVGGVRVSRRDFIFTAAVGTGAIIGAAASPAAGSNKASQKAVQYQPIPKAGQRCAICKNFALPASCTLVDGPISPAGWCMLYQIKK